MMNTKFMSSKCHKPGCYYSIDSNIWRSVLDNEEQKIYFNYKAYYYKLNKRPHDKIYVKTTSPYCIFPSKNIREAIDLCDMEDDKEIKEIDPNMMNEYRDVYFKNTNPENLLANYKLQVDTLREIFKVCPIHNIRLSNSCGSIIRCADCE